MRERPYGPTKYAGYEQHPSVARSSQSLGYTHDSSGCVHRLAKTHSRIGNSPRIRNVIVSGD